MIRHIVLFSAKNISDLPAIEEGLRLLAAIGEASVFEVGRNRKCDGLSQEIDVVVYAEFVDEAALTRYKSHPIYQQAIHIVRPLRDIRIAVDIDAKPQ